MATDIEDAISTPLIHIADVSGEAVQRANLESVPFLGTGISMREP